MKKNEKLFDAIGQIDERYIAEALEPMYQESVGTSDENKAAMPKKENCFFTGSGAQWRQQLLSLSALAQPELHSGGCIRKNPDRRWRPMIWKG